MPGSFAASGKFDHIFWGKFNHIGPNSLPLAAHCLDVALVFRQLSDLQAIRRSLVAVANESLSKKQLDRLAVLAMLHDVGKANLGFQYRVFDAKAPRAGHIRELAPLFDFEALDEELHIAFLQSLPDQIDTWFSDGEIAYSYFLASFSHHGRPLRFQGERSGTYWLARNQWWRPEGSWDPIAAVAEVTHWAKVAFPEAFEPGGPPLPAEARFHHRFAGLVMLADWLGSHPYWFPVEQVSLDTRLRHGKKTLSALMRAVGLDVTDLRPILALGPRDFESRFGFSPRPLQVAIDVLDPEDESTKLVIAESETGSGKTEAALDWFFKLFAAGKVDGLYFALPTRVAARELYTRVCATMERWFPTRSDRPVTVLAVPGYARIDGLPAEQTLPEEDAANRWQDDADLKRRARQWAAELPKRFLAATVAVGTIDQALLSAVQTAHAHLRSICLDRSLLVVDEVHASDFYMTRLLESLLNHHLSCDGRAMLLSATLGAHARHRYIGAVGRQYPLPDLKTAQITPYPAVTLMDGRPRPTGSLCGAGKSVLFEMVSGAFTLETAVRHVIPALAAGARVLAILNTVDRANTFLRLLESHPDVDPAWLFKCGDVTCPHHGRFAPADRIVLDAQVSKRLGVNSPPGPLLLVGTQTLEQSLDIDADLVISDLAPADVLLQRVGRLHRHKRTRSFAYKIPRCLLLTPEHDLESALDERGQVSGIYKRLGYGSVYEDLRTLELTRRVLAERPEVRIPQDNRYLVEAVTHPECLESLKSDRWQRHGQNIEGGELAQAIAASNALAIFDQLFGSFKFNEAGGKVVTRLGANSLELPLDRSIRSPFGQVLDRMVIPGHLAPRDPEDIITVKDKQDDTAILRCGNNHYRYSRYGLERCDEGGHDTAYVGGPEKSSHRYGVHRQPTRLHDVSTLSIFHI